MVQLLSIWLLLVAVVVVNLLVVVVALVDLEQMSPDIHYLLAHLLQYLDHFHLHIPYKLELGELEEMEVRLIGEQMEEILILQLQ